VNLDLHLTFILEINYELCGYVSTVKYHDIQVFSTSGGLAMFIFNPGPLQAVG